ncbi:phage portal protein [bacterium BS0013]
MAIDAWKRTCKILINRGSFEMEDCYLLMEYCNTVQLLYDANQEIKADGIGDETAAGGQKMGAAVKARDKYISQLIRLSVVLKLERRDFYIEFNVSSLLRGDQKSRYESYALGRQWGWLSVNDIRRMENMAPVEGGDKYLTPLNMVDTSTVHGLDKATPAQISEISAILQRTA